jgi:FtsH-binding integral membrane protein
MNKFTSNKVPMISQRIYGLMLLAYPVEFRREYGRHMAQLFRDCYRKERRLQTPTGLLRLWLRVLVDLATTAPNERLQNLGKGVYIVKALRNIVVAIIVYALAIVVLGAVLPKVRAQLPFAVGVFMDAFVSIGILFNFIVLLVVTTRLTTAARAVVTSAIVTVALVGGALSVIAMRVPADARPNTVIVLMVALSLAIWFTVHWMWAQRKGREHLA